MHSFESFEGTPAENESPIDDAFGLLELVEADFAAQHSEIIDQFDRLSATSGSQYAYHTVYIDGLRTNVFIRPIVDEPDAMRVTTNMYSINIDTFNTQRVVADYICNVRTGFITERVTDFEYKPGEPFVVPKHVGPIFWLAEGTELRTISGSGYRLPSPVGLFGGWGDEHEQIKLVPGSKLMPEKIVKGRLNNIERHRRLLFLLSQLGDDTLQPTTMIQEK